MAKHLRETTVPPIIYAARNLRKNLTASEKILWEALRERRCAGMKFRRQHPIGPFVLDFFSLEKMIAVEVDGSIHDLPDQADADAVRTQFLEEKGVRVIRINNEELNEIGKVLERIIRFAG